MISLEPLLQHVVPFLLVAFRVSGLFVFAPMLGSTLIPLKVRALFVMIFALAMYPAIPVAQHAPIVSDLFSLAPLVIGETLIGVALGLVAALPIYGVQLAGLIMGQQAGMGLAQIYNPALDTESDVIGQFLLYAAMVLFVLMGGLETLFVIIAQSFNNVPLGCAGLSISPVALLSGLASSGFELALRISSPVLCIILIETLASALVGKTIPQISVQSIGFAMKIMIAIIAMAASASAIMHAYTVDAVDAMHQGQEWATSLVPEPTSRGK